MFQTFVILLVSAAFLSLPMISLALLVSHRWAHGLSLEVPTDIPRLIQSDTRLSQISNMPINPGLCHSFFFLGGGGGLHLSLKESKVCPGVRHLSSCKLAYLTL